MEEAVIQHWRSPRLKDFRDPIFLLVNFLVWFIWPNRVSVFIFGAYGVFYFLAVLLMGRKYDGELSVSKSDSKTIFGLTIDIPPEKLSEKDEVIFEVVRKDDPQI